ncbi:MAG TPA: PAS domain-containing protein, partial [Polyangiaceae bacterium]|nr:PAS domain-containing protein [Polyangiaceae bacterium]
MPSPMNPGPKPLEGAPGATPEARGAHGVDSSRANLLALEAVLERLPAETREEVRRQATLLRARDLALSEERYRFLADTTTDLVWTETPDGAISFFNRHFARHAGIDPERGRGAKWSSFLHPDDVVRYGARRAVAADEG